MIYLVSAREFRRYLSRASQLGRGHPRLGVDLLQRHAVAFLDGLKRGRSLGERERVSGLQVSAPPRGNAHTDGFIHGAAAVLGSEPVGLEGSGFTGLEDLRVFALKSGCSESGAAQWAQDQLDALQLSEDRYRAFSFGIYEGLLAMLRPAARECGPGLECSESAQIHPRVFETLLPAVSECSESPRVF